MAVGNRPLCASAVPGLANIFPWYVLEGTYSFGDYCNTTSSSNKRSTEQEVEVEVDIEEEEEDDDDDQEKNIVQIIVNKVEE